MSTVFKKRMGNRVWGLWGTQVTATTTHFTQFPTVNGNCFTSTTAMNILAFFQLVLIIFVKRAYTIISIFTINRISKISHTFHRSHYWFTICFNVDFLYGYAIHTVSALVMFGEYTRIRLLRFSFITHTLGFGAMFVLRRRMFACIPNLVRWSASNIWNAPVECSWPSELHDLPLALSSNEAAAGLKFCSYFVDSELGHCKLPEI